MTTPGSSPTLTFPLAKAGEHVPAGFPPPHLKTWLRWSLKGVGLPRVRLQTWKFGGRRYTSAAAIARFFEALNAASPTGAATTDARAAARPGRPRTDGRRVLAAPAHGFPFLSMRR